MTRRLAHAILFASLVVPSGAMVHAGGMGALEGAVVTLSGVPVQGYPVIVTSAADGSTWTAITGRNGQYYVDGLEPGAYTATAGTARGVAVVVQVPGGATRGGLTRSGGSEVVQAPPLHVSPGLVSR